MAYLLQTATDKDDVVKKLVAFLVANGWTQDYSGAITNGWRAHAHKGACYASFQSRLNTAALGFATGTYQSANANFSFIDFYLGTGYNGASAWNAQAGGPIANGQTYTVGVGLPLNAGAQTALHCFSDASGDNIAVVVETTPGYFTFLMFGTGMGVTKHGGWGGSGAYFTASNGAGYFSNQFYYPIVTTYPFMVGAQNNNGMDTTGYIRADVDTFSNKWLSETTGTSATDGYTGKRIYGMKDGKYQIGSSAPHYNFLFSRTANNGTGGMAILLPVRLFAQRDAGGVSLLATIPNIFYTNAVGNGYASGSSYFIGADEYVLFPGFAVRKVS